MALPRDRAASTRTSRGIAWIAPAAGLSCVLVSGCDGRSRTIGEDFGDATSEAGAGGVSEAGGAAGAGGASGGSGGAPADPGGAGEGSGASSGAFSCTDGVAPTSQIPRLTNEQYERSVRDLLGVTSLVAFGGAAPSTRLAPYHTDALTELDWRSYQEVGQAVAAQVMADPSLATRFAECAAAGEASQCLHDAVVSFGRRAFRRPLTPAEIARFDAIIALGPQITETGSPEEVAEVLLNTFLVSPSFLLRTELSETAGGEGTFALSPFEVASRLSFLLWGSSPDSQLDAAADAGELTTPGQILTQAIRMVADPKARDVVRSFHRRYLSMVPGSRWESVTKDPEKYPEFTPAVARAMTEETERFFETIVFERGGSFADLFSSPLAFVNADTAPIYGLDASGFGAELEPVNLDPETRPGVLTRVGFLSAHSHPDRTSPVLRGAAIARDVFGIELGDPTPEAMATPLPERDDLLTNRQRVEAQTSADECSGCHQLTINPPGFVLEAFDTIGRFRTTEADTLSPIDTKAEVYFGFTAKTVKNPADLMRKIAGYQGARIHYVHQWLFYAFGRLDDENDECTIEDLSAKLGEPGYRVMDLLLDLTQTDAFRLRAREPTP